MLEDEADVKEELSSLDHTILDGDEELNELSSLDGEEEPRHPSQLIQSREGITTISPRESVIIFIFSPTPPIIFIYSPTPPTPPTP